MGLFDDEDDELDDLLETVKKYPSCIVDLNEGEVQSIYNRCLATEEEKKSFDKRIILQILQPDLTKRESEEVILSSQQVDKNNLIIKFLLGQIKNIHENNSAIGLQEGFIKYDNTVWTKDYDTLFKLYCLSQSCGWLSEFTSLPTNSSIISAIKASNCTPTLSPKDPNFTAWWEKHKAEWEEPKKEGKEPADD